MMGLNAVVFRKISNLPNALAEQVQLIDPKTGRLDWLDSQPADRRANESFLAANVRLGNVAMVAWLQEEVKARCKRCSVLNGAVLYSGTHSGDYLSIEQAAELKMEIVELRSASTHLPNELEVFLDSLLSLVKHAATEGNPIVFV